ncbi:MAG: SLBB domain-containing protein [Cyanosarcina radialis HA8281-LM2]|jgi:polysaccharide export outer membrane protein|nr:SLBB domain-containing protein [Cyanosarcina radialis HA8281-LM2]
MKGNGLPKSLTRSVAGLMLLAMTGMVLPPPLSAQPPNLIAQLETAYTLGGGDRIRIDVFNVPEYSGEYQVQVDGTVNLPIVGSIRVQGLTLQGASDVISSRYARFLRRPIVTLSLIAPRPIRIAVAGEVNRAGSYTIPLTTGGVPTVTQALQLAGGTTQAGNIRRIRITRQQPRGTITVDLGQVVQQGNIFGDISLRDGDRIFVPAAPYNARNARQFTPSNVGSQSTGAQVAIVGEVSRPGSYVVRGQSLGAYTPYSPPKLTAAIQAAGGLTPSAGIRRIQIVRPTRTGGTQRIAVNLLPLLQRGDFAQDIFLEDGDTIYIPTQSPANLAESNLISASNLATQTTGPINIAIVGEVYRPGTYPVRGESAGPNGTLSPPSVSQAIRTAGGLTPSASISQIRIQRANRTGRTQVVTVNLARLLRQGDFNQDVLLQEGDKVFIPTRQNPNPDESNLIASSTLATQTTGPLNIAIVGEVFRPGTYPVRGESAGPNGTLSPPSVSQAIKAAGGLSPSASIRQIQVQRTTRNGGNQTINVDLSQLLREGNFAQDILLQEGDKIYIPTRTAIDIADSNLIAASTLATQTTGPLNVAVVGEVSRPGTYPVKGESAGPNGTLSPPSVTQAIKIAGGLTPSAGIREIQVQRLTRSGYPQIIKIDLMQLLQAGDFNQDLLLQEGDKVFIPTRTAINPAETSLVAASSLATQTTGPISVAVVGEVNRPGTQLVKSDAAGPNGTNSPPTVTQAIQIAGGIKPTADIRKVQVRRYTRTGTQQIVDVNLWQLLQGGDVTQDIALQEGDTIAVPLADKLDPTEAATLAQASFSPTTIRVNVVGEVERPGTVEIPPNTPLNQGILAAGGFNRRARRKSVELVRLETNGTVTKRGVDVDFDNAISDANNPALRNNDVIIVGRSGIAKLGDGLNSVLSPLGSFFGFFNFLRIFTD